MSVEPVSGAAAAGVVGWKLLGFGALVGSGVLGAMLIAAFDPPKDRKVLFGQAAIAGVSSLFFGPIAVRLADHFLPFFDLANATVIDALELAAPVYLIVGALSWGFFGALAKLRSLIREKAADEIARRAGL